MGRRRRMFERMEQHRQWAEWRLKPPAYWETLAAHLRVLCEIGDDTIYDIRIRYGPEFIDIHPAMRALSDDEPGESPLVTYRRSEAS